MDFLTLCWLAQMLVASASVEAILDLETYMSANCSDPDKPYKCPPHAKCYGFEEFCKSDGDVESCFPWDISANDTAILERCRKPDTKLLHPTCRNACYSKFNKNNSRLSYDHITQPTVRDIARSSTGQDCKLLDCQASGHTTCTYGIFEWICVALLIFVLVEHAVVCFLCLKNIKTVWRFLRCKDNQGTGTDNHEEDIKMNAQYKRVPSGDYSVNSTVDPQTKDAPAKDTMASTKDPLESTGTSTVIREEDIQKKGQCKLDHSDDKVNSNDGPQTKDPPAGDHGDNKASTMC